MLQEEKCDYFAQNLTDRIQPKHTSREKTWLKNRINQKLKNLSYKIKDMSLKF
jgi:hypothetical protein